MAATNSSTETGLPPLRRLSQTVAGAARLFALGHPPVWATTFVPLTIVISSIIAVFPPLLVGGIVDALQRRDVYRIGWDLVGYCCVAIGTAAMGMLGSYATTIFRETMTRNIQLELVAKTNRARFNALSQFTPGQLGNRILGDARQLGTQMEYSLFPVLSGVCALLSTIAAMVRVDYRVALVALVCSFVAPVPLWLARSRLVEIQKRAAAAADEIYGSVMEATSISGLVMSRDGTAANRSLQGMRSLTARVFDLQTRAVVVQGIAGLGSTIASMAGPLAVLALGTYLAFHGALSIGSVVTLLIYQSRMTPPIISMSRLYSTIASMRVTVDRILEIADLPEEGSGAAPFFPDDISFRGVHLALDHREVLRGLHLDIKRGQHIGVVGVSGSGKSSLVWLMKRLYDPTQGDIQVGKLSLADFSLESLRSAVCVVSQEPFILDTSIAENLALGRPSVTEKELRSVLRTVRLDDLINGLPDGLETKVGQRGFRLSGGERQRICLARGLVQNPEILILDEALTGVDLNMEREILSDVRERFIDRTLIVVTHRLDSVRNFDRLVAMDRGVIAAQGDPNDLCRQEWLAIAASLTVDASAPHSSLAK